MQILKKKKKKATQLKLLKQPVHVDEIEFVGHFCLAINGAEDWR